MGVAAMALFLDTLLTADAGVWWNFWEAESPSA
jgi:hypothetical protein